MILFPSHSLHFHLIIVETTDNGERGMNFLAMTVVNPRYKYWPSRGSNNRHPVHKSLKHIYFTSIEKQVLTTSTNISLDSTSWKLHQYSRRICGPMKNPKVETRSRDSNTGPHDCKADALPHDHGHHTNPLCYRLSLTDTASEPRKTHFDGCVQYYSKCLFFV